MTTIKASCPTCGEVEMTSADVRLNVCQVAALSFYAFTCPKCHDEVRKPADDHVVSLLMSGGVVAEVWKVPAEALEPHTGLPLTDDDLIAFGRLLEAGVDPFPELRLPAPRKPTRRAGDPRCGTS